MANSILALLGSLALSACSVVGIRSGTEEPAYVDAGRIGAIVLRTYGPRLAAETRVEAGEAEARSEGFERLAGYIFGANTARAKIAMTAPVAQAADRGAPQTIVMTAPVAQAADTAGGSVVRFFLPASLTAGTAPVPDDPRVRIVAVPAETMAVLRFSGDRSPPVVAARQAELLAGLAGSPWRAAGPPVAWFYDPPWTLPWLRRNEVAVPVAAR